MTQPSTPCQQFNSETNTQTVKTGTKSNKDLFREYVSERGISTAVLKANDCKPGYAKGRKNQVIPAVIFPHKDPHTKELVLTRKRHLGDPNLWPREWEKVNGKWIETDKPKKSSVPEGSKNHLFVVESPNDECLSVKCRDTSIPIYLIEGEAKALMMQTVMDALSPALCVGVSGCWNWRSDKEPLKDFEWINWKNRLVTIVADSNILTNRSVLQAITKLAKHVESLGSTVDIVVTPEGYSGMDDYYAAQGLEKIREILSDRIKLSDWIVQANKLLVSTPSKSKGSKGKGGGDDDKFNSYVELTNIITSSLTLWRDSNDLSEVYCDLLIHEVKQTHKLRSRVVKNYIRSTFHDSIGDELSKQAEIDCILDALDHKATIKHSVFHRVGQDPKSGNLYYDLGDDKWTVYQITPNGWSEIPYSDCPIKFTRTVSTLPQSPPVVGGSLNDLQQLIPWGDDAALICFGFMLSAFMVGADKPILNLVGSQGSGKSKALGSMLSIVDPIKGSYSVGLSKADDIYVSSQDKLILTYDNLSKLDNSQSDLLCTISTGGSHRKRKLYSDSDEVILSAHLPQAITSVENIVKRPDLSSRCLTIKTDSNYTPLSEYQISSIREQVTPKVLGLLFDCLSLSLRLDDQHLNQAQRSRTRFKTLSAAMSACENRLGIPKGSWDAVVNQNQITQQLLLRDNDPLLDALLSLLASDGEQYQVTAFQLLHKIRSLTFTDPGVTHTQLGTLLGGSLGNSLRACGYDIRYKRTMRDRVWTITPIITPPPRGTDRDHDSKENVDPTCHTCHTCHKPSLGEDLSYDTPMTPLDEGVMLPATPIHDTHDTPPPTCHEGVIGQNPLPEPLYDTYDTHDTLSMDFSPSSETVTITRKPIKAGDWVEIPSMNEVAEVIKVKGIGVWVEMPDGKTPCFLMDEVELIEA